VQVYISYVVTQEAELSHGDRASHYVSQLLPTVAELYKKLQFKRLAVGE